MVCTRTYCTLSSVLRTQDDPEEPAVGRSRSPREARERGGGPLQEQSMAGTGGPQPRDNSCGHERESTSTQSPS